MAKKPKRAAAPQKKPQFFRVMLFPDFWKKLLIPRQFYEYIIREKCTRATILSPLNNSWQVKVLVDGNHLYFGDGWQEFVQAHGLDFGYFLVFSYEGEMVFSVTIFDRSTCMKAYDPPEAGNNGVDGTTAEVVKPEACSHEHSRDRKACKMMSSCMEETQFKVTIKSYNLRSHGYLHIPAASQANNDLSGINKVILRDPKMRLWPVSVNHHRRHGGKIHKRFGFGWKDFCSNNKLEEGDVCIFGFLAKRRNCTMHVDILKQRGMPRLFESNVCQKEYTSVVGKSLEDGEIKREQNSEDDLKFRRSVIPYGKSVDEAKKSTTRVERGCTSVKREVNSRKQKAVETMSSCIQGPHFRVAIKPSNLVRKPPYLHIPKSFKQHIVGAFRPSSDKLTNHQMTLRDPEGHLWPVCVYNRSRKRYNFAKGWYQFSASNKLRKGDICLFELVSKEDCLLHVHILR